MSPTRQLCFGPFRLDPSDARLWHGPHPLALTPKAFAVLQYLLEHPGELVTKEALFAALWPDAVVSDGALKVCLAEIRRALQDNARAPQFIKTEHRRGYRFIATVSTLPAAGGPPLPGSGHGLPTMPAAAVTSPVVGRQAELRQLQGWFEQALGGRRQVVFITGEAGSGKTTLADLFVDRVAAPAACWWVRGQCVDHHGAGEAYLPVLEAVGQLCRGPAHGQVLEMLQRWAPTWLVQLPWLLSAAEREAVQRQVQGASPERMLREMAILLEVLTAERPLVLVLEDLHWSDHATVDLIAWLARRREPARLLLIGTYRPVDTIVSGHPVRGIAQELLLHRQCETLLLEFLSEAEVRQYLGARFASGAPSTAAFQALADALHRRTDGHPLFMAAVADYAVQQGWLAETDGRWEVRAGAADIVHGVPESLRQMIEQQLTLLSAEERQVLEAASVAGVEFAAAAVAAGLGIDVETVEDCCAALARRGRFLRGGDVEEWPDGTAAGRYHFRHALYQQVVYERLPVGRRTRLHRRVGERQEAAYRARAHERAAELAQHFEQGREYERAVRYRRLAAENALGRWAYHEAIDHLRRGLDLLARLPDTPKRLHCELDLLTALGPALIATKGQGAPEVGEVYTRAWDLCQRIGETPHTFAVLRGLRRFYLEAIELQRSLEIGKRLLDMAQHAPALNFLVEAHFALGITLCHLGELAAARTHVEQGIAFYDPEQHRSHVVVYGQDPGVACLAYLGWILWMLGYPDQALQQAHKALGLAQELSHPFSLVLALDLAAVVHRLRREPQGVHERAAAAMHLGSEHGFPLWLGYAMILYGWALAEQGQDAAGLAQIQQGLATWEATGAALQRPHFLAVLAEVQGNMGQIDQGLAALAETLTIVHQRDVRQWEAELYRLHGELLLACAAHQAEAEAEFRRALEVARRQQAKSWELRAAISLSRLWQRQGKRTEAHALLAEVYSWFTEGFDTADLQEARALLEGLV